MPPEDAAMQTMSPAKAADDMPCASASPAMRERTTAAIIGTAGRKSQWPQERTARRAMGDMAQPCECESAPRESGRDKALVPGQFGRIAMGGFVNQPGEPEVNR